MTAWMTRLLTACAALGLCSCKARPAEHPTAISGRGYRVLAPAPLEPGRRAPALVVLHAFDTSAQVQAGYFDVERTFLARGFFVVLPEGTVDRDGKRFWNATDACCDQHGARPDDVGYLDAVLDDLLGRYPVDPKRVFLAGVSNGGFMAQRYACDRAARVRGFASVSGGLWEDLTRCRPAQAVGALLIHGDADPLVRYDGGLGLTGAQAGYPAAPIAARFWADRAGATATDTAAGAPDTVIQRWTGGAAPVELWTVRGAGHRVPRAGLPKAIADFFARP